MKGAEGSMFRFERAVDQVTDFRAGVPLGLNYAADRVRNGEMDHDARGLVIAILLCVSCWAALGFFLLG